MYKGSQSGIATDGQTSLLGIEGVKQVIEASSARSLTWIHAWTFSCLDTVSESYCIVSYQRITKPHRRNE